MSQTSHPFAPDGRARAALAAARPVAAPASFPVIVPASVPAPGPELAVPERPSRRRRPQNASWAYLWGVDPLSRRFFSAALLPVMTVLLLVAAVVVAVGLTFVAL